MKCDKKKIERKSVIDSIYLILVFNLKFYLPCIAFIYFYFVFIYVLVII